MLLMLVLLLIVIFIRLVELHRLSYSFTRWSDLRDVILFCYEDAMNVVFISFPYVLVLKLLFG